MWWIGVGLAVAAVAGVFVVLSRAMRKANKFESWGVGELSQRYCQPLPHNIGPPIEIVTEPDDDRENAESLDGADGTAE